MNSKNNHIRTTFWGRMFQEAAAAALHEIATKGEHRKLETTLEGCSKVADLALAEFDRRFNKPAEPKVLGGAAIAGAAVHRKSPTGDYKNAEVLLKAMVATFDNSTAVSEGWVLSSDGIHHVVAGGSVDGQAFKGTPFNSVAEAVAHVNKQAAGGSKYHQQALYLHLKATSKTVDLGGQHTAGGFINTQANEEGWGVFNEGFIQRLDAAPRFESDGEAIAYVALKAHEGSEYHKRAIDAHLRAVSAASSTTEEGVRKIDFAQLEAKVMAWMREKASAELTRKNEEAKKEIITLRHLVETYLESWPDYSYPGHDHYVLFDRFRSGYAACPKAADVVPGGAANQTSELRPLSDDSVRELEEMLSRVSPRHMASLVLWLNAHNVDLEKRGDSWIVVDKLTDEVFTTNCSQMCLDHLLKLTRGKGLAPIDEKKTKESS